MKVNEFRELEEDQLGDRLRAARRELYELRFKHAVGQLENSSQISKVRHDIARIMTVLTERELGLVTFVPHEEGLAAPAAAVEDQAAVAVDDGFEPEEPAAEVPAEDTPKPKRVRRAKTEEASS